MLSALNITKVYSRGLGLIQNVIKYKLIGQNIKNIEHMDMALCKVIFLFYLM